MIEPVLADQELIVHIFAQLDGPHAMMAEAQVRGIWSRCPDLLGTTDSIAWTGLRREWPAELHTDALIERAVAGQQGRTEDCQVILRQVGDVLGLSIILAAPADTSVRGRRIGSAAPAGWVEFDRWWGELAVDGTDKLLGVIRVYQAKHARDTPSLGALASALRAEVPHTRAEPGWWDYGEFRPEGFTIWELCPPQDTRPDRQIIVLAPSDRYPELCAWTWSPGGVALPPLARYLLHAAKIRCEARSWRIERSHVDQLRHEADDRVRQVQTDLNQPLILDRLAHDEAKLVLAGTALQETRLSTTIGSANMSATLTEPLPGDRGLVDWLVRELGDTATYLHLALQQVRQIRDITPITPLPAPPPLTDLTRRLRVNQPEPVTSVTSSVGPPSQSAVPNERTGLALEIVRYRERSTSQRDYLQQRVAVLVDDVLDDLGVRLADTDHQGTGAGVDIFLPTAIRSPETLPYLLQSMRVRLERSNRRFSDRMRLRLGAGTGTAGVAALGLAGASVTDVRRLVNSGVLRRAMDTHPDADLAALISDHLYSCAIEGDGPHGEIDFHCEKVHLKMLASNAWLWIARE